LDYQLNFTTDDGHPSTISVGLGTNEILKGMNAGFGLAIPLLTTEEILGAAGIVEP
jgi:hypothetical protein